METAAVALSMDLAFFRGRVALSAILKALGVGAGDEVAIQAFTCVAVPEGVMATGATPVYVDIEKEGFNLDVQSLADRITPSTRAVVVQHTFGLPAQMDGVLTLAAQHRLPVIEDCCHSIESRYLGRLLGTLGSAAFYSFEWGKPVVIGIGGAARANLAELQSQLETDYSHYEAPPASRFWRLQAQYIAHRLLYRPSWYWPVRAVYRRLGTLGVAENNYNPVDETGEAADFRWRMARSLRRRLGRKLLQSEELAAHSRRVTEGYRTGIAHPAVRLPSYEEHDGVVFNRYPLRVARKAEVLRAAHRANVELSDWYNTPVHPLVAAEWPLLHYRAGSCPEAERRCEEIVTLPTNESVSARAVGRAVAFLNDLPR